VLKEVDVFQEVLLISVVILDVFQEVEVLKDVPVYLEVNLYRVVPREVFQYVVLAILRFFIVS
jgi:hypothetical protein